MMAMMMMIMMMMTGMAMRDTAMKGEAEEEEEEEEEEEVVVEEEGLGTVETGEEGRGMREADFRQEIGGEATCCREEEDRERPVETGDW